MGGAGGVGLWARHLKAARDGRPSQYGFEISFARL